MNDYCLTIQMEKTRFDSLEINAVGHACFEPMIQVYQANMRRQGDQQPKEVRIKFYQSLSQGQRALFMFFTYYDHAIRSEDEFMRISDYYLSNQIFGAVKKGTEYFGDNDMLHLLAKIEQALLVNKQSEISEFYRQLHQISPNSLAIIGGCIKENTTEFIYLT